MTIVVAALAGLFLGSRAALADDGVRTTWGNIKCQYTPGCKTPKPIDNVDNKNTG